jgi:hypothetical protein
MRGPARQPTYGRAKNDPAKKVAKQQVANKKVEWLMAELQDRPDMPTFATLSIKSRAIHMR